LIGYAVRLPLIDRFSFREDEAIYSYWALHGWFQDPFFLTIWPDKPPLFLWLLGAAYAFFGIEPASARWVNIAAATLTIPIVAVTARRLWGDRAALVAALVMALSPFAISFSPTAFVDPLLVLAGSLSLCMAVFARPLAAGFWLGAAIMTKQQGLLYLPLIVAMLADNGFAGGRSRYQRDGIIDEVGHTAGVTYRLLRFLCGLALSTLPVIFWDSQRWATAPSPWDLSVRNYGRLTLASPEEWIGRMLEWRPIVWQITASSTVWIVFGLALFSAVAIIAYRRFTRGPADRRSGGPALILALWALGYVLLHIVTSIQVWDRYLLPLTPLVALLAGWAASTFPLPTFTPIRRGVVIAFVLLLAWPSWQAATGTLPIGSDHGDYAGLDDSLAWIDQQVGRQTDVSVLYHNVLGWHFQFYLYSQIQRGRYALRWFPTSTYLADNAEKTPHLRKFYVQPDWAPQPDLARRLEMRGLTLITRFKSGHFIVYEVAGQQASICTWCVCSQDVEDYDEPIGWQELELDAVWRSAMMASNVGNSTQ